MKEKQNFKRSNLKKKDCKGNKMKEMKAEKIKRK